MRDHDHAPSYAPRLGKKQAPAAALRRPDPIRRGPRPKPEAATEANAARRELEAAPDERPVLAAFDLLDDENANAPVIAAAPGFSVLVYYNYIFKARRVSGFNAHAILAWRLCNGGESPLPLTFGCDVRFHEMCTLAVQGPDGSVSGFDYGVHPNAAAWLRDRRRELGRRR